MKPAISGPIFVLAVIGCFALAFGGAYALEYFLIWLLEIRFRLPYTDVANILVTGWRALAALAWALLLCMWIRSRR